MKMNHVVMFLNLLIRALVIRCGVNDTRENELCGNVSCRNLLIRALVIRCGVNDTHENESCGNVSKSTDKSTCYKMWCK